MAWALVRAISARGAGDGGHLEQRGGEAHREAGGVATTCSSIAAPSTLLSVCRSVARMPEIETSVAK